MVPVHLPSEAMKAARYVPAALPQATTAFAIRTIVLLAHVVLLVR